jgi:diguanylate cyclase (GGDEF)-like protein
MQEQPIALFLIIPCLVFYSIAFYICQRRNNRAATILLCLVISLGIYTVAHMFRLLSTEFAPMFLWLRIEYIGIALYPVFWVLLMKESRSSPIFLILLFLAPAITLSLVWTAPLHDLFFQNLQTDFSGPIPSLVFQSGIWYWVQQGFIPACFLAGLIYSILRHKKIKNIGGKRFVFLYFALILPFAPSVLALAGIRLVDHLDLAPFVLCFSVLCITIVLERFELFQISPLARLRLIDSLEDPFLAVDIRRTAVDLNPGFLALAGAERQSILGKDITEIYERLDLSEDIRRESCESAVEWEFKGKHYEVRSIPLNRGRRVVGVIHYFHDFSKRKESEQRLRQSLLRLEKLNDLSRLLAMWLGKGDIMKVMIETATELLGAIFGAFFFLESGGLKERARAGAAVAQDQDPLSPIFEESAFEAITQAQTVRMSRQPYFVLAVPLNAEILHGQPGALVFITGLGNDFSDFDVSLAESVARQLAVTTENARLYREVERLAQIDGLTGVFTRRHFEGLARHAFMYAVRHKKPFCIIMSDIDFFKKVNDTYGHPAGDAVLRQVSERLRVNLREADMLGRYGGEEFIVLLPVTGRNDADHIAKRLHAAVSAKTVSIKTGELSVTASFGMSEFTPKTDTTLAAIIQRADKALYEAKHSGRNCIRFQ